MRTLALVYLAMASFLLMKSKPADKTCVSPLGKEVDWYVIFLFPETATSDKSITYGYFDNNSKDMAFYKYEDESFPGIKVVTGIDENKTNYFFWNDDQSTDEEKKSAPSSKAHSKGGLIFNENRGVLLSHSLPRFPRRKEEETILPSLPTNGGVYGQTFICISLNKENAIKVVESLNIINPALMLNVAEDLTESPANPKIEKLIKNRQDSKGPNSQITEVESFNGQKFNFFSKGKNHPVLPWDQEIPSFYKDGFYVETWTKPALMDSICDSTFQVVNAANLKFGNYEFNRNQDHSKWGVAMAKDVCCLGDLNRTESQKKRGGNVICFEHADLAKTMRSAITSKDSCPAKLKFLA